MKNILKFASRWYFAAILYVNSLAFGAVPLITGFSPTSGSNGTPVSITGANFGTAPSNNIVYFGAVRATVTSANQSNLLVAVPAGATYAPVTVLVNGLVAYTSKPFQPTFAGSAAAFTSNSFGSRIDFAMPNGPQQAAVGDLDGDGKPDLAVDNVYTHCISIFRNVSSGGTLTSNSLSARVDLPVIAPPDNTDDPYGVALADVDGDGKLDIVTFDRLSNEILVYRNISTPGILTSNSFAAVVAFPVGVDPRGVQVMDLDGDGRADIVCGDAGSGTISILRNIGTVGIINSNSFAAHVDFPAGSGAVAAAIGDLDGDGKPDIAIVNANDSTLSVYRNMAAPGVINSNSFAPRVNLPTLATPISIVIGDIDGDGRADLVVGSASGMSLSVYRNTATPGTLSTNSFAAEVDFPAAGWVHNIALGDLNGDGKTDIALVSELNSALSLFENLSVPGTFSNTSLAPRVDLPSGYNAWGVAVGDLDGDGRPDIIFGNAYDNTMSLYQNAAGSFTGPAITSQPTNRTVSVGGTANFTVTATGSSTLYYQWWRGPSTIIPGATSSTLTLSNVQPSDAGTYFVFVTNQFGHAQSSNAVLTVNNPVTGIGLVVPNYCTNTQINASGGEFNSVLREQAVYNASEFPAFPIVITEIRWRPDQDAGGPISTTISNLQVHLSTTKTNADNLSATFAQNIGADDTVVFNGPLHINTSFITLSNGTKAFDISMPLQTPFTYDPSKGNLLMDFRNFTGCTPNVGNFLNVAGAVDATSRAYVFDPNGTSASTTDTGGGVLQIIYAPAAVAPSITKQPTNQTVSASGTATFSVTATGAPTLRYQWYGPGSNIIVGAINPALTLSNVQPSNAGSYFVLVTNSFGSAQSSNAVLTVTGGGGGSNTCTPPPSGLVGWWKGEGNATDSAGTNNGVLVSGVGFGSGEVGQGFLFNHTNQDVKIPANSNLDVGLGGGLTLEAWISPSDVSQYNPIFEYNPGDGVTYWGVHFYAIPTGGSNQPAYLYADVQGVGDVWHQMQTANGVVVPNTLQHVALTYDKASGIARIYRNGAQVVQSTFGSFTPKTTGNLNIGNRPTAPANQAFTFAGIIDEPSVYNRALSSNEIGAIYNAGIAGKCSSTVGTAPTITKQPTNQTVSAGGTATFSVTATGSPTLGYQWYGPGSSLIAGAVNPTLTLSNVQPSNAGSYFVFVTNLFGFAQSSNAVLTVTGGGGDTNMAIVIIQQPTNQTVAVGGTATFSVVATGSPMLEYQWIGPGTNTIVGATNSTLTLSNVQPSAAGEYHVVILNSFGFVSFAISSNAVLTVTGSGGGTCTPPPSGLVAWWKGEGNANDSFDGNNGSVTGGVTYANGEVGQAFRFDGTNGFISVPASSNLDVGKGNGVTIEAWIRPDHLGPVGAAGLPIVEYDTASAIGVHFWVEANYTLYANIEDTAGGIHTIQSAAGTIVTNALQHAAVTYNKTNGICVLYINGVPAATANFGSITPQTTYPLFIGKRAANGFPGSGSLYNGLLDELSIYNRALSQAELQAIVAAGTSGKCTSTTSNLAPVITKQPTNQTVSAGGTATFSVTATGSPTLGYQWYGPGSSLIAGAVNPTLTLSNVQPSNAGSYFVFVTNLFGFAQSSNALLTVNGGGSSNTCTPPPSGLVGWWKGEGNALDSAGTNNGVLVSGVGFTTGEVGQGFLFTHTNQNVKILVNSNLNVGLGGGLTLEAWINPADISQYSPIMEWNADDTVSYFGVHLYVIPLGPSAGNQPGNLYADIQGSDDSWHQLWSSGQTVNSNQFQHVALTYDKASGIGRLYYNGTVVAENNFGNFTPKTTGFLNIGSRPTSPADEHYTFAGVIDEPSVYNRALSSNEIAAIYNAGSNGKCSGTNSNIAAKITVPPTNTTVAAGGTATFSVTAIGTPPLHYQWYGPNAAIVIPGAINSTLTFSNVQPASAGLYFVVVSNLFGSDQSGRVMLTVTGGATNTGPVITKQPTNQTVAAGATATFSVTATGSPTLHYQWFGPGSSLIAGAVNPTLTLSNVQPSNAGSYFVFVTNSFGFAQSSNAVLTVTGGGGTSNTCTPPPSGLVGWWKAEGNGLDSAGTNDGTLLGGLGFTNGEVGQAFNFTDTTQGVHVNASPSLAVKNLTIEAWIRPNDVSDFHPILEYGQDTGPDPVEFLYGWNDPGGSTPGALFGIFRSTNDANLLINSPGGILPAGQWSHVAMTFNFTNQTGTLYLNGTAVGSSVFTNGVMTPQTSLPIHIGYRPNTSGEGRAGDRLSGGLDEVSIYNRTLSASEIQAIYHAGGAGKCTSETPLAIITQPTNTTAIVGSTAKLSVTAVGAGVLSYQWFQTNSMVPGATNSTLTFSNVQFSAAGVYHVVVSDSHTSVNSSNATLSVIAPPVATVAVVTTSTTGGTTFDLPINLVANGNENALSFTLNFDPARLTFSAINLGSNATNGLILPNTSQAGSGIIGVQLALPAGVTFNTGTQQIVRVTFNSSVVTSATQAVAVVSFSGVPVAKLLSDAGGNALPANFIAGLVLLSPTQWEGDAAPVPAGNGTVDLFDWVQVGRFVAGLDTITNGSEFQKVDCAPRNTLGDGKLTVADWVQAGRYAAGLDPLTPAGGPTSVAAHSLIAGAEDISSPRQITVQSGSTVKGMTVTLPITMVAQGDETALAFSLNFDPTALQYVSAVKGSDTSSANLVVNANQAAGGQVAMVLCLPSVGSHFPAGTLEIAKATFVALKSTTNNTVSFADQPVARSISDANATELTANFQGNSVIINPQPSVGLSHTGNSSVLSWPAWAGDFTLQAAGSLTPPINWTNVPMTLQTNGNNIQVILPTPDQQIFFRLSHP